MSKTYCLYCLDKSIPGKGYPYPCNASPIGSHHIVTTGEVKYRVKGKDGHIYLFSSVPEGYELIEKIVY